MLHYKDRINISKKKNLQNIESDYEYWLVMSR